MSDWPSKVEVRRRRVRAFGGAVGLLLAGWLAVFLVLAWWGDHLHSPW